VAARLLRHLVRPEPATLDLLRCLPLHFLLQFWTSAMASSVVDATQTLSPRQSRANALWLSLRPRRPYAVSGFFSSTILFVPHNPTMMSGHPGTPVSVSSATLQPSCLNIATSSAWFPSRLPRRLAIQSL